MHPMTMNYASRYIEVGVLSAMIVVLTIVCWQRFRRGRRPWLLTAVGSYNVILIALFFLA
jgi:hypothetical protein